MQQFTQRLRKRLSGKQLPSLEDFKEPDDWFDALFTQSARQMGIEVEDLTEEQRKKLDEAHEASLAKATEMLSEKLLQEWEAQAKQELKRETKQHRVFERRLSKIWNLAISKLAMLRSICCSIASEFNEKCRHEAVSSTDFVFDALTHLHAHACMIVGEIIVLLRHGFAHGAYSRWRTLHEIVVISYFILQHDNEVAERYLLHDHIESCRFAKEYQEKFKQYPDFFKAGGHEPVEEDRLKELEDTCLELCKRFGKNYKKLYGWAAGALNTDDPTFKKIEDAADLSKMRPFYKSASQHVHASPIGVLCPLGQPPSDVKGPAYQHLMIAGPSIFGLLDPGQGAAITLFQTTIALLSWKGSIGESTYALALESLCYEVIDTFLRAEVNTATL